LKKPVRQVQDLAVPAVIIDVPSNAGGIAGALQLTSWPAKHWETGQRSMNLEPLRPGDICIGTTLPFDVYERRQLCS